MPTNVVAAVLSHHGGEGHDEAVEALVAGTSTAAWCLAEPAPHDHLGAWVLDVRIDGDEVVLNGSKRPVDAAPTADLLLVTGRTSDGLTNVLVPSDTPGVTIRTLRSTDLRDASAPSTSTMSGSRSPRSSVKQVARATRSSGRRCSA